MSYVHQALHLPRHVWRLLVGLFFGCISLLVLGKLDLQETWAVIGRTDVRFVAAAALAVAACLLARSLRWWLIAVGPPRRLSLLGAAQVSAVGTLMTVVYPMMGEASRLLLLRRHGLLPANAVVLVLAERVVDTVTLLLLCLLCAPALPDLLSPIRVPLPVSLPVVAGAAVALMLSASVLLWFGGTRLLHSPLAKRLGKGVTATVDGARLTAELLRRDRRRSLWVFLLTLAAHFLTVAAAWAAALAVGMSISPWQALLLVLVLNFGLGFFPVPLGLGIYQAAGLLVLSSAGPALALATATVFQAASYSTAIIAAGLVLMAELAVDTRRAMHGPRAAE